ncbi:MFS transporter [Cumulibacter manganitolerans]|uniref:MFS transporter n=1 Tax=Cumulibacter manganitolerans TaxID=1884992 RepID=UPI001E2CFEFC|nr:MFS transporter [Cumulibacter manganitolerans]
MLSLCGLTVSLQQTSLVPALADLHHSLHTTPENVSWIITATLLTSAVSMPIISRLADMFGKRKMLLLCLGLVTVGSLVGALGGSLMVVLIGRALQGASFAIVPVGISVMRDLLPRERIGTAVAVMSATLGIGGSVGMPLGGLVYSHFGVNAVFLLSAVVGVVLIAAILLVVDESTIRSPGRVDYVGSVLLSGALLALLLAISKGATWGWTSGLTLGLFAAAVVLVAIWIPYELRLTQPLVDLRTMARRPVLITNTATVLVGFSMFGQLLGTMQLLTLPEGAGPGFGFTPLGAGLFLLPSGAVMVLLAPVSASISHRFGAKTTLLTGGSLIVVGYAAMMPFSQSVSWLLIGSCVTSAGVALAYAAMPTLIMRAVPVTETASANGLNALLRSIGTSSSSAVVAMVLAAFVVPAGNELVPSASAFLWVFAISGVAAAAGTLVALLLPRHRADLTDEEAFAEIRDPGAAYDPPQVAAERQEIEEEIAAGRARHH